MGSARSDTALTEQGALTQRLLEVGLTTLEANVLRMRHGIVVPPEAIVGDPPEGCDEACATKLHTFEKDIVEDLLSDSGSEQAQDIKQKIVRKLNRKS